MKEEKDALLRLAQAVTDGTPVDWDAEGKDRVGLMGRLTRLRAIEKIAAAHQGSQVETAWPLRKATDAVTADLSTETVVPGAPAPSHWGHLKIIEQIGQGGYGEVYRAHDSNLECEVALKLLRPDRDHHETDVKSFLDEARRLARVRHPNVLVVHGADRHDGRVGLWTDLLRGKTLEQSIEQQGPFGADEATLVGVDLCRALAAVHAAGLVHRDVKTSNVMREEGGRIVLMDFNSVTERPVLHGRSESDSLSGTPLFMAPEVLRGEDSGTASDIYSLGGAFISDQVQALPKI